MKCDETEMAVTDYVEAPREIEVEKEPKRIPILCPKNKSVVIKTYGEVLKPNEIHV